MTFGELLGTWASPIGLLLDGVGFGFIWREYYIASRDSRKRDENTAKEAGESAQALRRKMSSVRTASVFAQTSGSAEYALREWEGLITRAIQVIDKQAQSSYAAANESITSNVLRSRYFQIAAAAVVTGFALQFLGSWPAYPDLWPFNLVIDGWGRSWPFFFATVILVGLGVGIFGATLMRGQGKRRKQIDELNARIIKFDEQIAKDKAKHGDLAVNATVTGAYRGRAIAERTPLIERNRYTWVIMALAGGILVIGVVGAIWSVI